MGELAAHGQRGGEHELISAMLQVGEGERKEGAFPTRAPINIRGERSHGQSQETSVRVDPISTDILQWNHSVDRIHL